jgi:hypothetical protein
MLAEPMTPAQAAVIFQHPVDAHRRAYDLIHAFTPSAKVTAIDCTARRRRSRCVG